MPQTKFVLACPECNSYNYITTKNPRNVTKRLELSKYCPKCRKHTNHEETRLRK